MPIEARAQFLELGLSRCFPNGDGNIDRRQGVLVQTKGFTRESFDAVAGDGGTENARRDAQAQARMGFMIGEDCQREKRIAEFSAAPFHVAKFGRLMQSLARLERKFTDRKRPSRRVTDRGACGPSRDGEPAIGGRSCWPCARGIRGYGHDANYWD